MEISKDQAIADVLAVMYGDDGDKAYGWDKATWIDWLWDHVADECFFEIVLGLMDKDSPSLLEGVAHNLGLAVERQVNILAAEMDPDDLL